jgi:hypothetical protein
MALPWSTGEDDAVRAAAALVATPVAVYEPEVPSDDLRLRSFTASHDVIDRIGFDTDFAPVRRRRPDTGGNRPLVVVNPAMGSPTARGAPTFDYVGYADPVAVMPRRVTSAADIAERQYELLQKLRVPSMTTTAAAHLVRQFRKVGVPPSLACYCRLIQLYGEVSSAEVIDLYDVMCADGVTLTPTAVSALVSAVARGDVGCALAMAKDAPAGYVKADTWARIAATVLAHVLSTVAQLGAGAVPLPDDVSLHDLDTLVARLPPTQLGAEQLMAYSAAHAVLNDDAQAATDLFFRAIGQAETAAGHSIPFGDTERFIVAHLLKRLCRRSGDTAEAAAAARQRQRLALVSLAKERAVLLDGAVYASLLDACRAEKDVRGVAYFMLMLANRVWSIDACLAAADYFADGSRDKELAAATKTTKSRALKAYVDAAMAPGFSREAEARRAMEAVVRLARADDEVPLLLELMQRESAGGAVATEPFTYRKIVNALVRASAQWVPASATAADRAVADAVADDVTTFTAVFAGVPHAPDAIRACADVAAALTAASTDESGAPRLQSAAAMHALVGPKRDAAYVVVADAAAWAELCADPNAAQAVAKMMATYDQSRGACFVVGFDALVLAGETVAMTSATRVQKAQILGLAADWQKRHSSWFRVLPLSCCLAAAVNNKPGAPCIPWVARWAMPLRDAGIKRLACLVGDAAVAKSLTEAYGLKPVLVLRDLLTTLKAAKQ